MSPKTGWPIFVSISEHPDLKKMFETKKNFALTKKPKC